MPVLPVFAEGHGCYGATQERELEVRHDRRYTGSVRVVPLRLDDGEVVQATVWESVAMRRAAEIAATIPRVLRNKGWPPRQLGGWLDIQDKRLARLQAQTYVRDDDVIGIKPWPTGTEPPKPVQRRG